MSPGSFRILNIKFFQIMELVTPVESWWPSSCMVEGVFFVYSACELCSMLFYRNTNHTNQFTTYWTKPYKTTETAICVYFRRSLNWPSWLSLLWSPHGGQELLWCDCNFFLGSNKGWFSIRVICWTPRNGMIYSWSNLHTYQFVWVDRLQKDAKNTWNLDMAHKKAMTGWWLHESSGVGPVANDPQKTTQITYRHIGCAVNWPLWME